MIGEFISVYIISFNDSHTHTIHTHERLLRKLVHKRRLRLQNKSGKFISFYIKTVLTLVSREVSLYKTYLKPFRVLLFDPYSTVIHPC